MPRYSSQSGSVQSPDFRAIRSVCAARRLADVRPRLAVEPDDGILFLTVNGTVFSPDS
jgi:hypothetical protein